MNIFAFAPVCRQSQRPKEALDELQRLGLKDVSLENRLEVRNENGTHEIVLTGAVGRSWWDDSGITEQEFRDALSSIPTGSKITVLVNSEGGSVQEGLGIYNAMKARSSEITSKITGYAVSIASVFPLAAHKVISPKSAIWMSHKAWSFAQGNDEDMDKAAKMLREHNKMLVDIYVSETGKTAEEWEKWMAAETWIRGASAVDYGLADETDEDDAQASYRQFHPDFISRCKNLSPEILNVIQAHKSPARQDDTQQQNKHMRNKMLALLKTWGVETNDQMTDEQLFALVEKGKPTATANTPPATPATPTVTATIDFKAELEKMKAELARENTVRDEMKRLVAERRITQAQADKFLPLALKDESVLSGLRDNPLMPVAAEPVIEVNITADASIQDFAVGVRNCEKATQSWQRGNSIPMKTIRDAAINKAGIIAKMTKKFGAQLPEVMNANTIDSTLKRDVILQNFVIVDFARRTLPLNLFSTVFSNVPLEGTNKVQVPFYDLDTSASDVFEAATGYDVIGGTAVDNREITVGLGATDGGRWYQALSFSSEEMARQPWLKIAQLASLKADKLASDIVADVLSVITAANYGAAAITKAAALFDSDDLAVLKLACKLWPEAGRGLILDSAYDAALLKDAAFKHALNAASDSAIKEGRLFPRVFGFNYTENPTIPANGENLVGFAVFASAILVAFAPVPPVAEVRNAGTTYQLVVDPQSGASLEYRTFGNVVLDSATHTIESSFGWAKGNGNALKRIVSA